MGPKLLVGTTASPHGCLRELPHGRGQDRVREAYGTEKYERLKALKRRYDPQASRLNQNISATSESAASGAPTG